MKLLLFIKTCLPIYIQYRSKKSKESGITVGNVELSIVVSKSKKSEQIENFFAEIVFSLFPKNIDQCHPNLRSTTQAIS